MSPVREETATHGRVLAGRSVYLVVEAFTLPGDSSSACRPASGAAGSARHRATGMVLGNEVRLFFRKGVVTRERLDVNEVIREMEILLHNEAIRHSVSIRTKLAADLPLIVADRVQLQQVLMNLMINGIDAMKAVDGPRQLTLGTQNDGNEQLLVSVEDTGIGLRPTVAGFGLQTTILAEQVSISR